MAQDMEKFRIPLFEGSNYGNWKFRIETLLDELDLLKFTQQPYMEMVQFLEEDKKEELDAKEAELVKLRKRDRQCMSQIIQRMADSHLEYAKDKESAFDLWETLSSTFDRKGMANQLLTRKTLLSMKFDSRNDTLAHHFLEFDKLIRNFRSTERNLEELDIVCHLLLTMPPEYDNVVTAIETLTSENLTVAFVKNRLSEELQFLRGAQPIPMLSSRCQRSPRRVI